MKTVYVRPGKSRGYLRLGIDTDEGVKAYNLSEFEYSKLGSPLSGDELSDSEYRELLRYDMQYTARIKALHILSYGDNSERNLRFKLISKGIDKDIADDVTREMVRAGYINNSRQLERLILNEVKLNLTGPSKLIPKLIAKGYSRSDIECVIDSLSESGEIDFAEAKNQLLSKYVDKSEEEKKKILYKKGYNVC